MQPRQRVGRDTDSLLFFVFVFTATPKIKHSKGRSDTMSEGGEGKLFFVIHTVVCIPYEQMFQVRHGDESRKLSKYVRLSDCRSDCQWRLPIGLEGF